MATVDDLIHEARDYAATILGAGMGAINVAMSQAYAIGQSIGGPEMPTIDLNPPTVPDLAAIPTYHGAGFADPGFNVDAPMLADIGTISTSGEPGTTPDVHIFVDPGNRPEGDPGDPDLLANPPVVDLSTLRTPTVPDILAEIRGIDAPKIHEIDVPDAPSYQEPAFFGVSPTPPQAPPTGLDTMLRTNYLQMAPVMRSAIEVELNAWIDAIYPDFRTGLAAIEDRLATYLQGGTALTPAVQDQIYARGVTKADAEFRRGRATIYEEAARAGHTLPSPVVLAQVQQLEQGRRDANVQVARDLMVKIAEMEQQNLQFAVTQSANLRGVMLNAAMQFYGGLVQINAQAIDYARSLVDAIVKNYDVATRYSEVQARVYEAEGNVYQAKVRGALGVLEAYMYQVRGLEAQANVDTAAVNAYRARIEAVTAEANVYRAQVDIVTARAQIERVKTEIYQARVSAYAAQVNAYVAKFNGYEAAIRGEMAQVEASAEQVRAYSAQVDAYRAIIAARTATLDGAIRKNEGDVRVYESSVNAYRAHVAALADVETAKINSFDISLRGHVANANAQAEHTRAELARYEAALRAVIADADITLRTMAQGFDLSVHRVQAIAQLSTAAAANYAATAQAALSGMNTLVSQTSQQ